MNDDAKSPPPHGTDARYQAHLASHSDPCTPCRDAHARAAHARRHGVREHEARFLQLEAERLRPTRELDPLDETFRKLIGALASLWTTPPDDPSGVSYEWYSELHERAL